MYSKIFLFKLFFLLYVNVISQKDTLVKAFYENGNIKNIAH